MRHYIWETLNLLTCADSSTDTKYFFQKRTETNRNGQKRTETDRNRHKLTEKEKNTKIKYIVSCVTCHMSLVRCCMTTVTATDSPPANSPTMHSRLVPKDLKSQNLVLKQKNYLKDPRKKNVIVSQY